MAEGQFKYLAVRQRLPDGDEIADHEIEEHTEPERLINDLDPSASFGTAYAVGEPDPRFGAGWALGTLRLIDRSISLGAWCRHRRRRTVVSV